MINANSLRNHIVLSQNTASIDHHNSKLNCQDALIFRSNHCFRNLSLPVIKVFYYIYIFKKQVTVVNVNIVVTVNVMLIIRILF